MKSLSAKLSAIVDRSEAKGLPDHTGANGAPASRQTLNPGWYLMMLPDLGTTPGETYIMEIDPPAPVDEHWAEYPDSSEKALIAPGPVCATPGSRHPPVP